MILHRSVLAKGERIISSPLIHIWDRESMIINTSKLMSNEVHINPTVLLLNYAFSHPNSSVYLVPITPMIAINHNSHRMKNGVTPNAKLAWAFWNRKSSYVLQRNLEELKQVSECLTNNHFLISIMSV
jgi:hypothetical protein